jgi:hypothetical protein
MKESILSRVSSASNVLGRYRRLHKSFSRTPPPPCRYRRLRRFSIFFLLDFSCHVQWLCHLIGSILWQYFPNVANYFQFRVASLSKYRLHYKPAVILQFLGYQCKQREVFQLLLVILLSWVFNEDHSLLSGNFNNNNRQWKLELFNASINMDHNNLDLPCSVHLGDGKIVNRIAHYVMIFCVFLGKETMHGK